MASSQSRPKLVATIVASAFIMQQLDATVVTTALPEMAVSLHTDPVHLSVAVTSYLLGLAIFVPVSGWAADRFGSRDVFRAAIGVFTLGSVLCGLSNGVAELIAARILQGFGGAMMVPVGRLVLFRGTERAQLVSIMAYLQLPSQVGPLLGPPLGGFITTYASWRWVFLINVPIGIAGIVLAGIYITDMAKPVRRPLDWIGFLLTAVSLSGIMYGIEAIGRGFSEILLGTGAMVGGMAVGLVALRHMRRHPFPILDPSVFRIPTFQMNFWGGSVFRAGTGTLSFLLPLLFQAMLGMSAFASGLLTVASAAGSMTMKMSASPLLRRFGFRNVLIGNSFLCAIPIAACVFFTGSTPVFVIFGILLVGGFFQSLQFTSLQALAYADISSEQMSSATSIASMVQQLSRGFGISLVAALLHFTPSWRGAQDLALVDFDIAFAVSAVLVLVSGAFCFPLARDVAAEVSGHSARRK